MIDPHTLPQKGMLRLDQLETFGAWAVTQGWAIDPIPPKADYQVLRLRHGRELFVFYRRLDSPYAGTKGAARRLVWTWLQITFGKDAT